MKLSLNWISDYVDIKDIDVNWLINKFITTTAEIETVEYKGENIADGVAGKIISIEAHPSSEKLKIIISN